MLWSVMKGVFVLLILATVGSGVKYDGVRVKFGMSGEQADVKNFFSIPRSIHDAEAKGLRRTDRPKGPMPQLTMYCYPGRMICVLYGPAGFIAGLQVAFPMKSADPALKPERYFIKWSPPAADGEPQKTYWTATQYYVTEESLKNGAPTAECGATLQAGGVWVNDLNGNLMKIPINENEIKPPFNKQTCVSNMGVHYYYNVSRQFDCSTIFLPWYVMMEKGELVGVGFQTDGTLPPGIPQNERKWFEAVPPGRKLITLPDASECILDKHMKYGTLSIHIYVIDKPWEIKCEPGLPSMDF